ncbi:MAG: DUF3021 family protein [Clostridiales bacterium]|nr:DUF3021 family protein [Clostridiales bacterium]
MRRILRDTCIFAALMILTVFAFSIAGVGFTEEIKLVFELFGLAFILSVVNYVFDEITSLPILAGYLVKYLVIVGVVIVFGFIAGWFYPSNFWMAFIYVGVVAVIVYALDSVKTEKDIEEINEMLKRSKNETVEFRPLIKRTGWKVLLVLLIAMTALCASSVAGYCLLAGNDPGPGIQFGNYCLYGIAVSSPAALFLMITLVIYLTVYFARKKSLKR